MTLPVPARASLIGRLVLAVALALGASLAVTTPPASAAAATPADLRATGSPVPTLSWGAVPTADRYRVQGSEDASFANTLFNDETSGTSYTPTRPFRAGTLYWRVQASDQTGSSSFATSQVTIAPPAVPQNVAVTAPGGTVLPPVAPPVISWAPVAGATSYQVEMDAEGDGVGGTLRDNIRTTTYVWSDPQGVGERSGTEDFFVRVRARFDFDLQSDWSAWVRYDVAQLPPVTSSACATGLVCAPDPATGVRGSRTVQDVVFDWDPVKGAKQYEIWVALDRDFNNQVEKRTVSSTRYSPQTTYDNNNYFWKVRAYNAADQPTPWPTDPNVFQRRWPMAPSLVYPPVATSPVVDDDLYFQWSPVKHATRYRLDVGGDVNFTPGSYNTCYTASTTYTPGYRGSDPCMPSQGSLVYWRVFAYDNPGPFGTPDTGEPGIESNVSATGRFVYDSGAVVLTAPADGATVTVPTMAWEPSVDAERYRVTVTNASTGEERVIETTALSWTPTDRLPSDSDQADPAKQPDTFVWKVSAKDADGKYSPAPVYANRSFVLPEGPVEAGAQPLEPLANSHDTITSRFPSLSWQAWPSTEQNPIYYRLKVRQAGYVFGTNETEVLSANITYPSVTDWNDFFLSPGSYDWWVEARSASTGLYLGEGSKSTFTITDQGEVTGQRLALDGKAVDAGNTCNRRLVLVDQVPDEETVCQGLPSTPVLDWDSIPGAGGYMVYLSEDPDFTNLLMDPRSTSTQNSRWTPSFSDNIPAFDDNESGPAYYWFVRPCVRIRPFLNCGPDPSGSEDVGTNAFRKVSPEVVLTQPAAGASFADEVTFTWQDYYDTNQATLSPYGGSTPSHQSGKRYRIQVAQSATITDQNAIDDRFVDQATYTAFENTYPEGDLWWRVQAIDARDNRLSWSATRKIVKATPAPNLDPNVAAPVERPTVDSLARPTFGSHVSAGPVTFQWSAETFDGTWDIELYKNDDTTLSGANRVFAETVRQAAFAWTEPLNPSSEAYRWRVRRTDVRGKPGRWSDFGRFWVDPLPISLASPADGAVVDPTGAAFTWTPYSAGSSAQASRYVFDIDPVGGVGFNPGGVSTVATAWTPVQSMPSGSYTWTVTAYDARGNRIGSSPARRFEVDGAVRVVTPVQIQAPLGSAVGQTLTSTPPTWSRPDVQMTYQWLRDGNAIGNANGPTYTLTTEDYTRVVSLRVTGRKPSYTDGTSTSNAVSVTAGGALQNVGQPVVSGSAAVGSSLQVTAGAWSPGATRIRYQWLRQGAPIPDATGSGYTVQAVDAGKDLSVTVFASAQGFGEGATTTAAVSVARMKSTVTGALQADRVSRKKRAKLGITVSVPNLSGPTGGVQVLDKGKKIAQITLSPNKNGAATIKLPKLKKGKHKLQVVYLGNAQVFGSKSKKITLYITK